LSSVAGDLYHLRDNREFRRLPGFNYSRAEPLVSIDRRLDYPTDSLGRSKNMRQPSRWTTSRTISSRFTAHCAWPQRWPLAQQIVCGMPAIWLACWRPKRGRKERH